MGKQHGNRNSAVGQEVRTIQDNKVSSSRSDIEKLTHQANTLLEKNDIVQAYQSVIQLSEIEQTDAHTLVTAGLMALALGKREEAGEHFQRAVEKSPCDFDANYNLALLKITFGDWDEAEAILVHLIQLQPDNAALHNDLAVVHMNKKEFMRALQSFERALELNPDFSKARENAMQLILENRLFAKGKRLLQFNAKHPQVSDASKLDIKKWEESLEKSSSGSEAGQHVKEGVHVAVACSHGRVKGKRIAFFASQPTFLKEIVARLSHENETRMFSGQSIPEMKKLMEWSDVAWFEWCDQLIIEATKLPKSCKIVCRLHSYEAFTDMPSKVDWGKVDHLIFVNRSVKEIVERQVQTDTPATIIHNGVDITKYDIPPSKRYGKKIASVGYINYKKNPALLLYCFKKIHAYDPEYTLHIAGQHQDPRIQVYFEHFLRENPLEVHYHGWVEDMPTWYADKDFVISTSLFESFHYSVAEGMASGLMPLIHNWYGAKDIYPDDFLFNDSDECLNLLKRLETDDRHKLARKNRQFIVERYNQDDKYKQIATLLGRIVPVPS